MAKTGSFIKLDRGIRNNPLWLDKPFSKGQAWVDLLIMAQWKDSEKKYNGKVRQFIHGNVYTSTYELAENWGWSRNRVYRFLEELLFAEMVTIKGWTNNGTNNGTINRTNNGTKDGTIITIVNWGVYQYTETNDGTNTGTKKRTNNVLKTEHTIEYKNKKKDERINNKSLRSIPFPCGVAVKPDWMDEADWNEIRFRKIDDIPAKEQGEYDSYIEYAEECHRQGREIK